MPTLLRIAEAAVKTTLLKSMKRGLNFVKVVRKTCWTHETAAYICIQYVCCQGPMLISYAMSTISDLMLS